ncbi:MAG: hypothetical protein PW843_25135 [Azospirillaceae bacterium]|nr:hypothetical protein [Azospirillaceae bacterium]
MEDRVIIQDPWCFKERGCALLFGMIVADAVKLGEKAGHLGEVVDAVAAYVGPDLKFWTIFIAANLALMIEPKLSGRIAELIRGIIRKGYLATILFSSGLLGFSLSGILFGSWSGFLLIAKYASFFEALAFGLRDFPPGRMQNWQIASSSYAFTLWMFMAIQAH